MPKRQTQGNAQFSVVSGSSIIFDTTAILANAVFTSPVLRGQGLPVLTEWFLQTAGAVGATVQIQFAHGTAGGVPDFQPLKAVSVLALGTTARADTRMGAYFYRFTITAPGANGVTVRWWLAASNA